MRTALTTLALVLCACGPGPILLVDVEPPMGTQRLQIYSTSDNSEVMFAQRKAHTPLEVDGAPTRLSLELPKGSASPVTVSVHAVGSADRCVVAIGSNESPVKLDNGAGPYKVPVPLTPYHAHQCDGGGAKLRALSVLPGSIVYAVGDQGRVLRWDPQRGVTAIAVSGLPDPPPALNGVFAASDSEVWAVGAGGLILKGGAAGFSAEPPIMGVTEDLHGVHGANAQEVWAVGSKGLLLRRQATWSKQPLMNVPEDLFAVRARSSSVVVVVGDRGAVLSGDATGFKRVTNPMGEALRAITAVDGDRFWITGDAGRVLRYQFNQGLVPWSKFVEQALTGVWASDSSDVRVVTDKGRVLTCHDTKECTDAPGFADVSDAAASFTAIAGGQDPNDLWLAGTYGTSDLLWHVVPL